MTRRYTSLAEIEADLPVEALAEVLNFAEHLADQLERERTAVRVVRAAAARHPIAVTVRRTGGERS